MNIFPINHQLGSYSYSTFYSNKESAKHGAETVIENQPLLNSSVQKTAEPRLLPTPIEGRGSLVDILV